MRSGGSPIFALDDDAPQDPLYAGYRYPAELISYAIWLYFRFPLGLRMVEEMLAARGISVTYETIRRWGLKFGREFANRIRRRAPCRGDKWGSVRFGATATNLDILLRGARLGAIDRDHVKGWIYRYIAHSSIFGASPDRTRSERDVPSRCLQRVSGGGTPVFATRARRAPLAV